MLTKSLLTTAVIAVVLVAIVESGGWDHREYDYGEYGGRYRHPVHGRGKRMRHHHRPRRAFGADFERSEEETLIRVKSRNINKNVNFVKNDIGTSPKTEPCCCNWNLASCQWCSCGSPGCPSLGMTGTKSCPVADEKWPLFKNHNLAEKFNQKKIKGGGHHRSSSGSKSHSSSDHSRSNYHHKGKGHHHQQTPLDLMLSGLLKQNNLPPNLPPKKPYVPNLQPINKQHKKKGCNCLAISGIPGNCQAYCY